MERGRVAVDASACTENSKGYFDIVFMRLSDAAATSGWYGTFTCVTAKTRNTA